MNFFASAFYVRAIARTYDSKHRQETLATDLGYGLAYGHDAAGRLQTITQGFHLATYGYKANVGTVETVTIKRVVVERVRHQRTTDDIGRVSRIKTTTGATIPVQRDYTYNAANQRTQVAHEDTRRWAYGYDDLGQVTSGQKLLADGTTPLPGYSFGYNFDDIGNRDTSTTNNRTTTYAPNLLNQSESRTIPGALDVRGEAHASATITVNGGNTTRTDKDFYREIAVDNSSASVIPSLVITGTESGQTVTDNRTTFIAQTPEVFSHDLDGNRTQDARWSYTWDAENRLIAAETPTSLASAIPALKERYEYAYDAQSRRIQIIHKTWDTTAGEWATQSDTRLLYDARNLITELDALTNNTITQSHVWGLDYSETMQGAGGVGGLLWTNTSTHTFAANADAGGNIVAWTNTATLAVSGRTDYGPFGEIVMQTGIAKELRFGFSSCYTDSETGFIYFDFVRFYSPSDGCWLSMDNIGETGGLNLYGMVKNNPVNLWDIFGLAPCEVKLFVGHNGDVSRAAKSFGNAPCSAVGAIACRLRDSGEAETDINQGLKRLNLPVVYGLVGILPSYYRNVTDSNTDAAYRRLADWGEITKNDGVKGGGISSVSGVSFTKPYTITQAQWDSQRAYPAMQQKMLLRGIVSALLKQAKGFALEKKCDCPSGIAVTVEFVPNMNGNANGMLSVESFSDAHAIGTATIGETSIRWIIRP